MTKIDMTTGGIYRIRCKPSNKQYIGNSQNIALRLADHVTALRSGTHLNSAMQRDWEAYGADAFEFEVLEIIEGRAERYRRESLLLRDSSLKEGLYNTHGESSRSNSKCDSTTFSLRLPEPLHVKLEQTANGERRSVNNLITKILAEWVESQSQAE